MLKQSAAAVAAITLATAPAAALAGIGADHTDAELSARAQAGLPFFPEAPSLGTAEQIMAREPQENDALMAALAPEVRAQVVREAVGTQLTPGPEPR